MRWISFGRHLGFGMAVVLATACTSGGEEEPKGDDDDAEGGTGGMDATGGMGGDDGATGGTGGSGDEMPTGAPGAVVCPAPTESSILDFTNEVAPTGDAAAPKEDATWGDFSMAFSGGTFWYPSALTSQVSQEGWRVTGSLDTYGGLGFYFSAGMETCTLIDASAFSGIELTVSGDTDGHPMTVQVGTASNAIGSEWLVAAGDTEAIPNFGQCTPKSENQYDGTCGSPSYQFDVPASPTKVQIMWSDLIGGAPEPSVNPAQLTSLVIILGNPTGVGTDAVEPYDLDVVIHSLAFIP